MRILSSTIILLSLGSVIATGMDLDYVDEFPTSYKSSSKSNLIKDCSDKSYLIDVKEISLTPAVLVPGETILIEATGTTKKKLVKGAYANVVIKVGNVQIMSQKFDLCDEMVKNKTKLQCPIKKGKVKFSHKIDLPKDIPKADFKVEVRAFDVNDEKLACLNIAANFSNLKRLRL
ncbi:ML domain-containing protein [Phycomyces nitens]|nr:ML domain-containing protein [Phycomyces nitens]